MELRRDFLKYVSLNVIGMIGISCYILADTFFVAKALGATGLAALNFSTFIFIARILVSRFIIVGLFSVEVRNKRLRSTSISL